MALYLIRLSLVFGCGEVPVNTSALESSDCSLGSCGSSDNYMSLWEPWCEVDSSVCTAALIENKWQAQAP